MLTQERMVQIEDLVDLWEEKERQDEEYPDGDSILGHTNMGQGAPCYDRELLERAAKDMGISPEELDGYFTQDLAQLEMKIQEEREIRDLEEA